MASIIQFLHPGAEHGYDENYENKKIKNWNTENHRRKFLSNKGSYIENDKKYDNEMLLFWGEWEPTSWVKIICQPQTIKRHEKYPKYLHFPFLPPKEEIKQFQDENIRINKCYQNTDPFIFGKDFRYAICQQNSRPCLKKLDVGSLILFGSSIDSNFVIDTVFVVGDKKQYNKSNIEKIDDNDLYPEITIKMACKADEPDDANNTLYYGATYENRSKVNGMFSFVPSIKSNDKKQGVPRFYFPDDFYESNNIILNKYISKKLTQGIKATHGLSLNEIKSFWEYLKNKISEKYVLGFNFEMPKHEKIGISKW